jgi:hypothetical protein
MDWALFAGIPSTRMAESERPQEILEVDEQQISTRIAMLSQRGRTSNLVGNEGCPVLNLDSEPVRRM